jgi:hypothetical protein
LVASIRRPSTGPASRALALPDARSAGRRRAAGRSRQPRADARALTLPRPRSVERRQGNDRGTQYRSGIFYHDEEQRAAAEARVKLVNEQLAEGKAGKGWAGNKVVATVEPCGDYYLAEAYHQQYLARGGRGGNAQSAAKGCNDPIRCYG